MDKAALKMKILLIAIAAPICIGLALFVPAGTLGYWQAWAYIATLIIPMCVVVTYFWRKDPAFLERRLRLGEKEVRIGLWTKLGYVVFLIGFLVPGLDQRFGWSQVPPAVSIAADAVVFISYLSIFLVFRENSYASRTIQVEKGQKVISSGPYSIVRHPMYIASLVLYAATPIALGSYVAIPPFLLLIPIIVQRLLGEEEMLKRELPGYVEYCGKVRYRLVPYIW